MAVVVVEDLSRRSWKEEEEVELIWNLKRARRLLMRRTMNPGRTSLGV